MPPYRIGALDRISISVFQENDVSARNVQVDASGNILLPLIGEVRAMGHTSSELAAIVQARLGRRFLVNPQVSVTVDESASQRVTVIGSVIEPGVYSIRGRTTLLDAVAMAKGTARVAAMNNVVIFRVVDGKRIGALFNLRHITRGEAADPEILGNDAVVIGHSDIKAAWRDLLTAAPLLAVTRPFN